MREKIYFSITKYKRVGVAILSKYIAGNKGTYHDDKAVNHKQGMTTLNGHVPKNKAKNKLTN